MQDFCERLIEEKISLATLNADLCLEQMEQMEKEGVEFMDVHKNDVHRKKKRGAIHNLYFAGEVLDLNGPSGGFNLQICWSTGYVAGRAGHPEKAAPPA